MHNAPLVRVVVVRMLAVKFGDGGLKGQKAAAQLRALHGAATSGEMKPPAPHGLRDFTHRNSDKRFSFSFAGSAACTAQAAT